MGNVQCVLMYFFSSFFSLSSLSVAAASGVAMAMQDSETSGGRFMGIDHWHK